MTTPPPGDIRTSTIAADTAAPFAVTAPPELTLDATTRTGETSFTVTNLTGRPVRARLVPRGQSGAADTWFTLSGEAELPLGVGATVTVAVRVAVPPEAPAGQHAVRLDVVAEDDTEAVAGQTISFAAPPPSPPPPRRPWLIAIIAGVVLLLAGGLTAFFLTRGPDLPVNGALPAIEGRPIIGATLTANPGVWDGEDITFSHQWLRCPANGAACLPIDGADQATFALTRAELGQNIRVAITATNPGGTAVAESESVGPVRGRVVRPPVIRPPIIRPPTILPR